MQNHGYDMLLVETLDKEAKSTHINKIAGQVHASNKKVIGFYKKLGYREDDVITLKKDL